MELEMKVKIEKYVFDKLADYAILVGQEDTGGIMPTITFGKSGGIGQEPTTEYIRYVTYSGYGRWVFSYCEGEGELGIQFSGRRRSFCDGNLIGRPVIPPYGWNPEYKEMDFELFMGSLEVRVKNLVVANYVTSEPQRPLGVWDEPIFLAADASETSDAPAPRSESDVDDVIDLLGNETLKRLGVIK